MICPMPDLPTLRTRVLILGSGPAGLTAAMYAARAGLEPLVVDGLAPGGQLANAASIENFPGYPEPVLGADFVARCRAQAERWGARFVEGEVDAVDVAERPFTVVAPSGRIHCDALIVATGSDPRRLGVPGEERLLGYGVSTCATCDAFFYRDQDVIVVGGGDTAVEDALHLAADCRSVTVVVRRDALRASRVLAERARAHAKIQWAWGTRVAEIHGEAGVDGVTGATLVDVTTGVERRVACQGVFVAIGRTPRTEVLSGKVDMDAGGYIRVSGRSTETSVRGVFAAGQAADGTYGQAVTAAGTGCMAAMDAERFLGH
jgi:thioredoxin reductase (NADPH)